MKNIKMVRHGRGAKGLRYFGMGPNLQPVQGLQKLKELFDHNTFWAKGRSLKGLKIMLSNSTVVITMWDKKELVGFGRATSDGVYRAVLWDVIVPKDLQGQGLGRKIIECLLSPL